MNMLAALAGVISTQVPTACGVRLSVNLGVHDAVNSRLCNGHDCEWPPCERTFDPLICR